MSEVARIKGDLGEIKIEVIGYMYPQAKDTDDRNWLRVQLEIKAGPFRGSTEIAMMTTEILGLLNELIAATKTLVESIRFETLESNWSFDLDFERTGTAVIKGKVTPHHPEDNSLHYEFQTDPISLEGLVRDLQKIVTAFPFRD